MKEQSDEVVDEPVDKEPQETYPTEATLNEELISD